MSDLKVGRIAFGPTPGPWRVSELDHQVVGPVRVLSAQGTDIPQLQAVARIMARTNETEANAALISAAPDLYAALKAIVEHEQIDGTGIRYVFDFNSPFGKQARAAIAKAEGRA